MPEPVSAVGLGLLAGYAALQLAARSSSAISPEAGVVRQSAMKVVESVECSEALFGEKAVAISQLFALSIECGAEGWDGNGAAPINPCAVTRAADFIRALPADVSLPEFSAEPDGCISLDWMESRNRVFTLSVGSNDRLAYAWLDGSDQGHAVTRFDGNTIPSRILEGIEGIVGHGCASLRAA